MSLVSAVCCQAEVSATGWSLVQRSPTQCVSLSVCVCVMICNKNTLHLQCVGRSQAKKERKKERSGNIVTILKNVVSISSARTGLVVCPCLWYYYTVFSAVTTHPGVNIGIWFSSPKLLVQFTLHRIFIIKWMFTRQKFISRQDVNNFCSI